MAVAYSKYSSSTPGRRIALFLILSLLLHAVTVGLLENLWLQDHVSGPEPLPESLKVKLAPSVQPSNQIVDAPRVNDTLPEKAEYWGVRDQSVLEEMLARNLGPAENASLSEQVPTESEVQEQEAQPEGTRLAKLLPDPYSGSTANSSRSSKQQNAVERQLGPVTLLNTKSHPYSQYLIDRGYRAVRLLTLNADLTTWYFSDVRSLRFPAMVRVTVTPDGNVTGSAIEQSSGSSKVDRMLLNALQGAVRGTPPPADAMENGQIELVLALEPDVMKIGIR